MYDLSVYPMTFDLRWHWKVKSRSWGVDWAVYHRQCIIRQRSCQGWEVSCFCYKCFGVWQHVSKDKNGMLICFVLFYWYLFCAFPSTNSIGGSAHFTNHLHLCKYVYISNIYILAGRPCWPQRYKNSWNLVLSQDKMLTIIRTRWLLLLLLRFEHHKIITRIIFW